MFVYTTTFLIATPYPAHHTSLTSAYTPQHPSINLPRQLAMPFYDLRCSSTGIALHAGFAALSGLAGTRPSLPPLPFVLSPLDRFVANTCRVLRVVSGLRRISLGCVLAYLQCTRSSRGGKPCRHQTRCKLQASVVMCCSAADSTRPRRSPAGLALGEACQKPDALLSLDIWQILRAFVG